jgi:hypothetical protein
MKRESTFRRSLVVAIKSTRCIAQPIETGLTGLGVPDLFVRTSKVSAWIELKNYQYPLRYPLEVSFRPGQAMWLERHYKLGGLSILGIATLEGNYFFANESIQRVYNSDMADHCDYYCSNIIGKEFIKWLDNLQVIH